MTLNRDTGGQISDRRRLAACRPIALKFNYVVATAIANDACKFHNDRLNDGVTIYFIVAKPRGIYKQWNLVTFFAAGALRSTAYIVSVTHRTECRAACVWTAVRSVYGQPKSKN